MDLENMLRKVRAQMYGAERALRLMRADVEGALNRFEVEGSDIYTEIPTGLGNLLSSNSRVDLQNVQPYVPFYDGVWGGYDTSKGRMSLAVCTRSLQATCPGDALSEVTRFVAHPVFTSEERPGWCSIEVAIDTEIVRQSNSIRFDMVSHFDVYPEADSPMAANFSLVFRQKKGPDFVDLAKSFLPVTTVPFETSMSYTRSDSDAAGIAGAESFGLIALLPTAGRYRFNIDYFSAKSADG